MVRWLIEKKNAEVITFTGDLGHSRELSGVKEKAIQTGALRAYVCDLKKEFLEEYVFPALKAGALYEKSYVMATSLGRPLLAKGLVEIARKEGATMVAHGCTGKGNDQVRFEVSVSALAPDLVNVAPLREWEFKSREEEIAYAQKHGIPVSATVKNPYSIDENIWGTSVECGVLEDPMAEPPADAFQRTVAPELAPAKPEYVEIIFEQGIPVMLNGAPMDPVTLVHSLNVIGGAHGVGRLDLVENRLVGIKSREFGRRTIPYAPHGAQAFDSGQACLRHEASACIGLCGMVYNGLWFSPLRLALDAFVNRHRGPSTASCVSNCIGATW
jgi:argininosuccinate synthase